MKQGRSKLDNWGGGLIFIYIRVHTPQKQSISKEINCAEHEYMNISPPPNNRACYGPVKQFAFCRNFIENYSEKRMNDKKIY